MKPAYFGPEWASSGISVEFTKSTGTISVSGWYDSFVGIQGETLTIREFFDRAGIDEDDCRKAFRNAKKETAK